MKRKLTKRNKKFLSSRYGKYLSGHGTFQRHTCHSVYFSSSDEMMFKRSKYKWRWFFNDQWMMDTLSQLNQEMERYI